MGLFLTVSVGMSSLESLCIVRALLGLLLVFEGRVRGGTVEMAVSRSEAVSYSGSSESSSSSY